jgi:phosphatidylserine decarboxylase
MNQECAERNEQNIVTVRGEGIEVVFKQIAGLIARRIVFNYGEGDRIERGQRVGMIKFGSRTDIILPPEAEIRVKIGQRVKGGSSIIAEMPESATAAGVSVPRRTARATAEPEFEDGERE